jgi:hypothetical protein
MSFETRLRSHIQAASARRPEVTSYDSGYEHSMEHWIELRMMVEDIEEKTAMNEESWELVPSA